LNTGISVQHEKAPDSSGAFLFLGPSSRLDAVIELSLTTRNTNIPLLGRLGPTVKQVMELGSVRDARVAQFFRSHETVDALPAAGYIIVTRPRSSGDFFARARFVVVGCGVDETLRHAGAVPAALHEDGAVRLVLNNELLVRVVHDQLRAVGTEMVL
jgi:hypothetical protein